MAPEVTTITPLSAGLLLFMIMDPFGNMPVFVAVLKNVEEKRRRWVVIREMLIALAVLLLFLFAGRFIVGALGISETSLSIAGGVLLFIISLRMVFTGVAGMLSREDLEGEPLIFPLAIPFTAGPSAIAAVMLFMSTEPEKWAWWLASVIGAWLPTAVLLAASPTLSRIIGPRGLAAAERLFGMLLIAIAVQIILNSVLPMFSGSA